MKRFNYSYYARERLIDKIDTLIEEKSRSGKVCDQMNAIHAREKREEIAALSRTTAYKLEKRIFEAEYYDPAKDKFGFGPKTINPTDYTAFLREN